MYVFFKYTINVVCWLGVVYCWFPLTKMTLNKYLYPKKVLWCVKQVCIIVVVHPKLSYFTLNNLI